MTSRDWHVVSRPKSGEKVATLSITGRPISIPPAAQCLHPNSGSDEDIVRPHPNRCLDKDG